MPSFFNFFLKRAAAPNAAPLYGAIMAQLEGPVLIKDWGMPETPPARLGLLALHMFLVLQRLKAETQAGKHLSRALVEYMVSALDADLREQGIGDVGVLKRMKAVMQDFYAHLAAYDRAFISADALELARACDTCLFAMLPTDSSRCQKAADYMRAQSAHLAALSFEDVAAAKTLFVGAGN